jgi:hypothetical protein
MGLVGGRVCGWPARIPSVFALLLKLMVSETRGSCVWHGRGSSPEVFEAIKFLQGRAQSCGFS